jgi:hypothetical protein
MVIFSNDTNYYEQDLQDSGPSRFDHVVSNRRVVNLPHF